MFLLLFFVASVIAIDSFEYQSYHYPSAREYFQYDVAKKRSLGPKPHGDYSDKSIARQWNEVLLSAIRRDQARPTTHARNLYHTSVAMWEAWRVYYSSSVGGTAEAIISTESRQLIDSPTERKARFEEALSFACFTLLAHRFKNAADSSFVDALLHDEMRRLGYNASAILVDLVDSSAAATGIRIASEIIEHGKTDGSCEQHDYECVCKNPASEPGCVECGPEDERSTCRLFYEPYNKYPLNPYWNGPGVVDDPNRWQRLEIGQFIDQAGVAVNGYPRFTGPQWGFVVPFALDLNDHQTTAYGTPRDPAPPRFDGVFFDPGEPPRVATNSTTTQYYIGNHSVTALNSAFLDVFDGVEWNQSPSDCHIGANNFFATNLCDLTPNDVCRNKGINWKTNPHTGKPYGPNKVLRGDYVRVLAEFWADGPQSETPPGHWNTILNTVMDHPAFEFRWAGRGSELSSDEWCIKAYLALNAAMHDTAIASWGVKHYYDFVRPITAIRWMSSLGQSTDKSAPAYHPFGMPLILGHSRIVRPQDVCRANCGNFSDQARAFTPGPDFRLGFHMINQTAIKSWDSLSVYAVGVDWLPGQDWRPYQRPSFVSPPFAGYVSGHATFSRAAADMLSFVSGDKFFPGGLGTFHAKKNNFLVFETGPSRDVELQWATYGDAADECSLSRIYGGIHPPCDDLPGRHMGRMVAKRVWQKILATVGQPFGAYADVSVWFRSRPEQLFASELAAMAWAQKLGAAAHTAACQGDRARDQSPVCNVTDDVRRSRIRLLPRHAGQGVSERTIELRGVHPNTTEYLHSMLQHDPRILQSMLLNCTELGCEKAATSRKTRPSWSFGLLIALTVVVLLCIFAASWVVNRRL